jgi:phenylpyruvate tautomerase PptA (4-oxalocrotonate tautomerase family)
MPYLRLEVTPAIQREQKAEIVRRFTQAPSTCSASGPSTSTLS